MLRVSAGVIVLLSMASWAAWAEGSNCEYPNVMIVVDRSGSMYDTPDGAAEGKSKYEVARDTIQTVLASYGGSIRFGICLFPWGFECEKGLILVMAGDNTAEKIILAMDRPDSQPNGATPIGDTLNALAKEPLLHETGRRNFVLFITDGGETCDGDPVGATKALHDSGVGVFVVGFGSGVDADVLQSMANSGGHPRQAAPTYYQVDNDLGLYDALNAIMITATTDICDGLDNDCNGQVDDNIDPKRCAGPCGVKGEKLCQGGAMSECQKPGGAPFTEEDKVCSGDEGAGSCSCSALGF